MKEKIKPKCKNVRFKNVRFCSYGLISECVSFPV